MDILCGSSNTYFSKFSSVDRNKEIVNSSVSVGLLERLELIPGSYDFQETAFAHPDSEGKVPRVPFAPIEIAPFAC